MKFGVQVNCYRTRWDDIQASIQTLEAATLDQTPHIPIVVADDAAMARRFIKAPGPGTVAGPKNYVIGCIGECSDAGVTEIMFGARDRRGVCLKWRES